ncbi:hypothetical protein INR49_013709 [Caranx melampygus]|nr:hypothetical protein INR49_013709 [Caranx melampygus]
MPQHGSLAFSKMTFPFVAMMETGLFFSAEAELTGEAASALLLPFTGWEDVDDDDDDDVWGGGRTGELTVGVSWRLLSSVVPSVKGPDSTFFRLSFTSTSRSSTSTLRRSASRHASSFCFRRASSEACCLGSEYDTQPFARLHFISSLSFSRRLTYGVCLGPQGLRTVGEPSTGLRHWAFMGLSPRSDEGLWDSQARSLGRLLALGRCMEEGAHRNEVQVDPAFRVLLGSH